MTTSTLTLAAFLEARLAEDEAAALAATQGPWVTGVKREGSPGHWRGIGSEIVMISLQVGGIEETAMIVEAEKGRLTDTTHIARHDPARVLAEVASKRAILAEHVDPKDGDYCPRCGSGKFDQWEHFEFPVQAPCPTLRALASVYSDHSHYDPAWA